MLISQIYKLHNINEKWWGFVWVAHNRVIYSLVVKIFYVPLEYNILFDNWRYHLLFESTIKVVK